MKIGVNKEHCEKEFINKLIKCVNMQDIRNLISDFNVSYKFLAKDDNILGIRFIAKNTQCADVSLETLRAVVHHTFGIDSEEIITLKDFNEELISEFEFKNNVLVPCLDSNIKFVVNAKFLVREINSQRGNEIIRFYNAWNNNSN